MTIYNNTEEKEQYKSMDMVLLNHYFLEAIKVGNLELVSYFLTSPDLKRNVSITNKGDEAFVLACKEKKLNIVEYLLSSSELKEHPDVNTGYSKGLLLACENNDIDLVKFLLTSEKLQEHSNLYFFTQESTVLRLACQKGHVDIVRFLIRSPSIKKNLPFNNTEETNFKYLWDNRIHTMPLIRELFIVDEIELTKEIRKKVNRYSHDKYYAEMLEIFDKVELMKKLKITLKEKPIEDKKLKL